MKQDIDTNRKLEEFGTFRFEIHLIAKTKIKIYLFNQQQATLIDLLTTKEQVAVNQQELN
ncbi:hypothetical protein P7H50_03880 [Enterococcus durans]|uniref:hypothetical protein n=1 Tax=Enterococcus TaxID=1350 RepID=UPI00288D2302|nr:hypothetical protein [Enterococcus durans]MDT2836027.1 hypothetical protein [Enterococcus durans]